jgi:hypothetical protein
MAKRLLALVLLLLAVIAGLPYLQQARALQSVTLNLAPSQRAAYEVDSTKADLLFGCRSKDLVLQDGADFFTQLWMDCWNRYPTQLSVTFTQVTGTNLVTLSPSQGFVTVQSNDVNTCRSVDISSAKMTGKDLPMSGTVVFRAAYSSLDGDLSGTLYIPVFVTVFKKDMTQSLPCP